MQQPQERRKYERYDTQVKIYFDVAFDVQTRVKYQILDKDSKVLSKKYPALSKNVSAEGLSFVSQHNLQRGDYLNLEIYLPNKAQPVRMEGEVCWSAPSTDSRDSIQSGILLKKVNGQPVHETIHFDNEYNVNWSIVLESILGQYKDIARKRKK